MSVSNHIIMTEVLEEEEEAGLEEAVETEAGHLAEEKDLIAGAEEDPSVEAEDHSIEEKEGHSVEEKDHLAEAEEVSVEEIIKEVVLDEDKNLKKDLKDKLE